MHKHSLAENGAKKLWKLVNEEPFINALGALSGNQAMQQAKAGLKAVYFPVGRLQVMQIMQEKCSDQSLYPVSSVPDVVRRINNALTRCDQIQWMEGNNPADSGFIDYLPIVADAEVRVWRCFKCV